MLETRFLLSLSQVSVTMASVDIKASDALLITGTATAVATAFSLLASLWWRRVDRREADWLTLGGEVAWEHPDEEGNQKHARALFTLANAGDATAFRVRITGVGCTAMFAFARERGHRDVVVPIGVRPSVPPGHMIEDLAVVCSADAWHEAFLVVTWIASPTRRRWRSRRGHVVRLSEACELPEAAPSRHREEEPEMEPKNVRRQAQVPLPRWRPLWLARWLVKRRLRRRAWHGQ